MYEKSHLYSVRDVYHLCFKSSSKVLFTYLFQTIDDSKRDRMIVKFQNNFYSRLNIILFQVRFSVSRPNLADNSSPVSSPGSSIVHRAGTPLGKVDGI